MAKVSAKALQNSVDLSETPLIEIAQNVAGRIARGNKATLSDEQIANIIFNESRSLSGPNIERARRLMAHAIINGDEKFGKKRPGTASSSIRRLTDKREIMTMKEIKRIVRDVRAERDQGKDPSDGTMNFNFRHPVFMKKENLSMMSTFYKKPLFLRVGPLDNSFPTNVLGKNGVFFNLYKKP